MADIFESPLPFALRKNQVAVPQSAAFVSTSSPAVVAATPVDLYRISLTNTTGSTVTFTLTDGADVAVANISAINVDPNQPLDLEFRQPLRCSGLKWVAGGAGIVADLYARIGQLYTASGTTPNCLVSAS